MNAHEALDRLTYDAAENAGSDGVYKRVLRDREEVACALEIRPTGDEVQEALNWLRRQEHLVLNTDVYAATITAALNLTSAGKLS